MKLLRYGPPGQEKPGLVAADGSLRDLSQHVLDISPRTLDAKALDELRALDPASLPRVEEGVRIGTPIANVGKLICVGLNYADHAKESNLPVPSEPVLFMKATSAICGPNDQVIIPRGAQKTDWEVELGIVIGKRGRDIPLEEAAHYIFGYTCVNDVTAVELLRSDTSFEQWTRAKNFDGFTPFGPYIETELDCTSAIVTAKVNGRERQNYSVSDMFFSPQE